MLAEIQTDPDEVAAMEFNKEIPVMPLRNMVMFPSVVMPVTIGRPSTLKLVNAAYKKKLPIAFVRYREIWMIPVLAMCTI